MSEDRNDLDAKVTRLLYEAAVTRMLVERLIDKAGLGPEIAAELGALSDVLATHEAVNIDRVIRHTFRRFDEIGLDIDSLKYAIDHAKHSIDFGEIVRRR